MNNRNYSVLILGNFEDEYVTQFVKNLKKVNPQVELHFWGYTRKEKNIDQSFITCYDDYCLFDIKSIIHSSFGWRLKAIKLMRKSFYTYVADKHFDYINIHYIKPEYYFLLNSFKKCASHLVLTPWGSDVYRIGRFYKFLVKRVFDKADFITGPDDRFTRDFTRIFNIPLSKIIHCDLGVAPIEYIIEHKEQIDTNEAKRQLHVDNNYIITCGYNANPVHQHIKIIEAILEIRSKLPNNLTLFFPLTYPKNPEYIQEINDKVKKHHLNAVLFDKFLDIPQLFLLRQATDLFIHVQPTDASSGTLYEYILCEKKILNGAWLKYPDIERKGIKPYYLVENMDNLGQAIVNTYKSEPIKIDQQVLKDLEKKQWKVVIKDWDQFFSNNMI